MHRLVDPVGEARDDHAILAGVAERLGAGEAFTEGRSAGDWLRWLYTVARQRAAERDIDMPEFAEFWARGVFRLPPRADPEILMAGFRADPEGAALRTPSGKIEIFSETIASFGYDDCPGHPVWLEPAEWLGSPLAARYPLHLVSNQPGAKLHSQYDLGPHCEEARIGGREVLRLHPDDAAARGIGTGDLVRVFNDRGACLAAARVRRRCDAGRGRAADGRLVRPGGAGGAGDARAARQPERADAGQGQLAAGAGAGGAQLPGGGRALRGRGAARGRVRPAAVRGGVSRPGGCRARARPPPRGTGLRRARSRRR